MSTAIELNILSDWIVNLREKEKLEERLPILKDLGMVKSYDRLSELLGGS